MCMYHSGGKLTKKERAQLSATRKKQRGIKNIITYMSDYIPAAYERWEAEQFMKIMFYRKEGEKKYLGFCECGATVSLKAARSGRMIECPVCKSQVRLTRTKYGSISQEDYFALLDRAQGGWVQRLFVTRKESSLQADEVHIRIRRREEERDYTDGEDIRYFHPVYGDSSRWEPGMGRLHGMGWTGWRVCNRLLNTYPENLRTLFRGSKYEYSAVDIATEKIHVNALDYLHVYNTEPQLEMLFKLGLYRVGDQLLYGGYDSDASKRLIRRIKTLKDLGITGKEELAECRNMTIETLIARKEVKTWKLPPEQSAEAIDFVERVNRLCDEDFEYSFMTRREWFKYYLTQADKYDNKSTFIRDYTDYINDCMALNYDCTDPQIFKPKDLTAAHARSIQARKYMTAEKNKKVFCTQVRKWLKKGYTDGVYAIAVIPTPKKLVAEAQKMRNCSAGYADRIATGKCSLWTVRRCETPEEAFYMLELSEDGRIVQCRGVATNSGYGGQPTATPEVQAFVDKWRRKMILPALLKNTADTAMIV